MHITRSGFARQRKLFDLVGYDGLTEQATAKVDGECMDYRGIQMMQEVRVILTECLCPDSVDPVETNISIEQYISSFGHYCTAILHDDVAHLQTQLLNL